MLDEAVKLLRQGEVVGIPTETVYGLAGSINSELALRKIFSVKGRPFFDPLIVHVASVEQAQSLVSDWPQAAQILAEKFWPGPLTMVLPKADRVSDLITSGLETVAVRMPRHKMALQLIEKLGVPLAAPSANKFGKTSPSRAEHVKEEFSQEGIFVLDGGPCEVGLESTVIRLQQKEKDVKLTLLRAGNVLGSSLKRELESHGLQVSLLEEKDKRMAPGQMKHHYMPVKPLVILKDGKTIEMVVNEIQQKLQQMPTEIEGVTIVKPKKVSSWSELNLAKDPAQAAREMYSSLRIAANGSEDIIFFRMEKWHGGEDWEAILDRLTKAASVII